MAVTALLVHPAKRVSMAMWVMQEKTVPVD